MNIKAIRDKLCLTQQEFAEMFGFSRQAISNWEIGRSKPYARNKRKIIEICEKEGIVWQDTK